GEGKRGKRAQTPGRRGRGEGPDPANRARRERPAPPRHKKVRAPAYMPGDAYPSGARAVVGTVGSVGLVRRRRMGAARGRANTTVWICRHRRRRAVLAAGRRRSDGARFFQQPARLRRRRTSLRQKIIHLIASRGLRLSSQASNILFGNLQKITSQQLGLSPILMAAANSSGGVMGKMIDAQSIVVASTATNWFGHEGTILRFVFKHSIALACLVGVLVMLQAYVFTGMIVH